jgi:uncharacterized protein YdcH (DUF465 family)
MEDLRIREILLSRNTEFKKLFLEHQEFEDQLLDILQKKEKNEAEIVAEQNIKKQKLKIKDEMQKHIFEFKKRLIENG